MANFILTPLMSLPNPVPGADPGPDYANNLQSSLNILDQHNHSPGSGNQVNPSGIDINSDLTFNTANNAVDLRTARFTPQVAPLSLPTDLGAVYVSGADLFYNDTAGNQVQITSAGAVLATSSGISSGTASASFVSSVLVVNANTNTPANIRGGSLLLGNNIASSHFLTLAPPSAMGNDYQLNLPAIPGATSFMTLDTSGNMAGSIATSGGITSTNIANNGISRPNLPLVGQQQSSSCGSFGPIVSATGSPITNLTVTITTTGRPVMVSLQGDGTQNNSFNASTGFLSTGSSFQCIVGMVRDNTTFLNYVNMPNLDPSLPPAWFPPSALNCIDVVSAGTHTYEVVVSAVGSSGQFFASHMILTAYEL